MGSGGLWGWWGLWGLVGVERLSDPTNHPPRPHQAPMQTPLAPQSCQTLLDPVNPPDPPKSCPPDSTSPLRTSLAP